MTIQEQFAKTLILDSTLEKVKKQFISKNEITPVDEFDMNFRLLFTGDTINLELLATGELGYYFKPIGFYDNNLNVYILKEFENEMSNLINIGEVPGSLSVRKLSIEQNGLIGAFSIEAFTSARKMKDSSFRSNGLDYDIFMSFDGDPQVFLDDKYNFPGVIAVYLLRGESKSINPTYSNKELFDNFSKKKLLSAFNTI